MVKFAYTAVDEHGHQVTDAIDAIDRRAAVAALAGKGQFVTELLEKTAAGPKLAIKVSKPAFSAFAGRKIAGKNIPAMTAQLSTALRAGLTVLNALEIIRDQQTNPSMRALLDDLAGKVRAGKSFSEATAEYPRIFTPLYVSMLEVGETGGILEQTTTELSRLLTREEKIKSEMKNAATYPLFVLAVGIISVIIVVTYVLPRIMDTIGAGLATLPLPTRMLMWLSNFFVNYWLVLIILVAAISLALAKYKNTPKGRLRCDSLKLKTPILGQVLLAIAVGRFARTLGSLTRCGIAILQALGVVRDTLGNELLAQAVDHVAAKVKTGRPLAEPLAETGYFPPLLVQIVSIGEQTGKLDELLLNAADTFDEQADAAITRFMALFPAVLIMLLAVVIGFIIAATLLPIVAMELGGTGF